MTPRTSRIYQVGPNDTLGSIATRFQLSSWRAISHSPENRSLLASTGADSALTEGEVIKVPPVARALLVERIFVLQRIRPMLQLHFQALEDLLTNHIMPLEIIGNLGDERTVMSVLAVMATLVKKDVELAHQAARPIAEINNALSLTHLHDREDLAKFVGGNSEYTGLNWVLTPLLVEPWFGMWSAGFWAARWRDANQQEAKQAVAIHLNLIRSKIMQQADQRITESYRTIWSLDREAAEP